MPTWAAQLSGGRGSIIRAVLWTAGSKRKVMAGKGIVIVGGGHGGSQIAASLREKGYAGPLTLISAESEIPYQRPPLSKAFLKDPSHDLLPLRPMSFYEKNKIDLRL